MSCGNHHDTDCSEVLLRIYEYLDGEMGPDDRSHIRQHLEECGPCLREYDLDQMLKALVRRSCAGESAPERAAHADPGPDHHGDRRGARLTRSSPAADDKGPRFLDGSGGLCRASARLRRWACGRGWRRCPCGSGACGRACSCLLQECGSRRVPMGTIPGILAQPVGGPARAGVPPPRCAVSRTSHLQRTGSKQALIVPFLCKQHGGFTIARSRDPTEGLQTGPASQTV